MNFDNYLSNEEWLIKEIHKGLSLSLPLSGLA